ncbi:hypothetical protein [Mesorhizobium ventifaucium]|uniref:Uncharacterized protein n=1 Tax=Mesorhizobium ventifaucium TaxID=666020 RepID=A0ABN8JQG7_9HYPH|nr:hypothetical protein [Mesorhizobium ventifaucium]CAH2399918.1 hypothetical protein MES4922_230006 [Mesorhizobium ventifaucium]
MRHVLTRQQLNDMICERAASEVLLSAENAAFFEECSLFHTNSKLFILLANIILDDIFDLCCRCAV